MWISDRLEATGRPALRMRAAWWTMSRAAFSRVCMSASRLPIDWCSTIFLPNCVRSFAYDTAASSAARAMPTA